MSDPSAPPESPADLEEAAMPFLTLVSSLLVLLIFGIAGLAIYRQLERERELAAPVPAEEALRLMRDNQEKRLSTAGYDRTTNSTYIPITTAMERLAESKGAKK
jgi:hypothetical protein